MNNYAIILAAGIGSRLYPLTQKYPKSLVKVNGREILDYQIKGYIHAGIKEENIFIVTGYKHEMITSYLNTNYPAVKEVYSPNYLSTNNMYSLYLGLNAIKQTLLEFDKADYIFINNADCLYDASLMYDFVHSAHQNAIACEIGTYIDESMKVSIKANHALKEIAKTISKQDSFAVSIDLYKYSSKAISRLYEIIKNYIEVKKDLKQWTEVAFPELFKTEEVFPYDIKHRKWVEVDNIQDLLIADKLFSGFDIKQKKAFICDLDGTIYVGKNPIPNAIQFVQKNNFKYYFLTNNTSKTPQDYVNKLASFGIQTCQENIITPLFPLIEYLRQQAYKSVYLVANQTVSNFIKSQLPKVQFEYNPETNKAVILTYDTEINYIKMKEMSYLLEHTKVEYIATHHDIFCPSENGNIPDIGCYIKMFELTTHRIPDIILGKPSVSIIQNIINKYKKEEIAIVGDRLYTDKKLADNAKCDFVCVLSGETTRLDIQQYIGPYPALVVQNLGNLNLKLSGVQK